MIRNAIFIFGICTAIFLFFLPSYLQMQELHEKNSSYEHQIHDLTQENEALLEEKRRLEEDPAYFERFAREKFGIIKDGEVVYKIVPAGTSGTKAASGTPDATVAKSQVPAKAEVSTANAAAVKKSDKLKKLKRKKKKKIPPASQKPVADAMKKDTTQ
jgi:cell division protein FtsB